MIRNLILGHHDKAIAYWLRRVPWPFKLLFFMLGGGPLMLFFVFPARWVIAALLEYEPAKKRLQLAEIEKRRLETKINDLEFEKVCLKARLATRYRPADIGLFKQKETNHAA